MKHKTENGLAAHGGERNDWNWIGNYAYKDTPSPQMAGIIHVKDGKPVTAIGKRLLRQHREAIHNDAA